MPVLIAAMPDASDPTGTPAGHDWLHDAWAHISGWANTIPTYTWVVAVAALTVATIVCVPALRTLSFKAGARHGKKQLSAEDLRDRRLLIAAMIPASLFWIAVLIGSGRGLIAFGRDNLHWTDGWEYLVPFTLDGVAIAFALLAFRAVRKEMNPDRAVRIAAAAMLASAGINFLHEVGGSKLGAGYLAILSLLGMLIFDELLAQFEEGAEHIKRSNPKFGLRWITWPTNTVCAWVAWRNYPPAAGTKATVANAVANLEGVRRLKVTRQAGRIDTPAWWMRFAPWAHVGALQITLAAERVTATEKITSVMAKVAELTVRLDEQAAVSEAERVTAAASIRDLEDRVETLRQEKAAEVEEISVKHAEELRQQRQQLLAEMAEKVAKARAEASIPNLGDRRKNPPAKGSPRPTLTDEDAVQRLLDTEGGWEREWSQKAIVDALSVGYGRAPRLLEQVAEAQRQRRSETHTGDQAVNE